MQFNSKKDGVLLPEKSVELGQICEMPSEYTKWYVNGHQVSESVFKTLWFFHYEVLFPNRTKPEEREYPDKD